MLEWAKSKPWIWAWLVAELVSLPSLLLPHHWGQLSSTGLASSPSALAWQRQSQLSCSRALRASSPHLHPQPPLLPPMPTEPALLCCPGEVQGLLSQVLQPVRDRASSSFFMTLGQLFHDAQERDGTSSTQPSDINTDPGSSPDQGSLPCLWR